MSLEAVAERLGKTHSTISRWENGRVTIPMQALERLAEVYGISRQQLEHPPAAADMVAFLDRAQHIVSELDPEDLEKWISLGEALRRKR